ncbi:MAG: hypothetical protein JWP57_2045 [Spirosoma sp.]|nr:hypothetical protein [Spirosoma sp.]
MNTIDPKDLMVGSLIADALGKPYEVLFFDSSGICDMEARSLFETPKTRRLCDFSDMRPMPLTTQWLEKLGFTMKVGPGMWCLPDPKIDLVIDRQNPKYYLWKTAILCEITSVHHLQALVWHLERVWLTVQSDTPTRRLPNEKERMAH